VKAKIVKILLALILAMLIGVGCIVLYLEFIFDPIDFEYNLPRNPADDPPGSYDYDYYQIDPSAILTGLKSEGNSVFLVLPNEPESFLEIYPSGFYPWSQEDYLSIAKAHHLYMTGESVEKGWKIYGMGDFGIYQCRDGMHGFDSAKIIFYKKNPDGSFPVTYMYIRPLEGLIHSALLEFDARKRDDGFQEAKAMAGNVTADEALQIAENAGGKAMRQKLSNDGCDVWVIYYSGEYWHVDYSWNTDDLDFDLVFEVNANDGSYKVSRRMYKCERDICP
jgi:hypothetical protein